MCVRRAPLLPPEPLEVVMIRKHFEQARDFLLKPENQALIAKRERTYKIPGAEKVRRHLEQFAAGSEDRVNINLEKALDILDWRVVGTVNQMCAGDAPTMRAALSVIWAAPLTTRNASAFWSTAEAVLRSLPAEDAQSVNGMGTRASLASFLLFLQDPTKFPFYRPHYGGKAMLYLYGRHEALDASSPSALLFDYQSRCTYLLREFRDAGIPLTDMTDLQSALYVLVQGLIKPQK